jgi:hypothetical protein
MRPKIKATIPRIPNTALHENQYKTASDISGASTKLKLGANS